MTTIKGLPVYNAILLDEGCGIDKISLVDLPAVESNFLAFGEARRMLYAVKDEDKHLLYGCVMRANFPIYRADEYGEYWIVYKPDVIRQMAEKYLADGKANNVNLMHEDGTDVDGVQMVQWFIKDTEKGIAPVGFEDIEDGSLFGEFHVSNDEVWAAVKDGVFKGFSLEGMFGVRASNAVVSEEKINHKQVTKMSMLEKFREVLAKVFAAFGAVSTDKGVLFWDGDEDLKAEDAVYTENENGERVPAADGDYTVEDGKVIVVTDGKVAEIKDAEAEVASEPESNADQQEMGKTKSLMSRMAEKFSESYNEKENKIYDAIRALGLEYPYIVDCGDDYCVVNVWTGDSDKYYRFDITWDESGNAVASNMQEVKPAFVPVDAPADGGAATDEGNNPADAPVDVEHRLAGLEESMSQLVEAVGLMASEQKHRSMAKPAHEEFREEVKPTSTGNAKLDKFAQIASCNRK